MQDLRSVQSGIKVIRRLHCGSSRNISNRNNVALVATAAATTIATAAATAATTAAIVDTVVRGPIREMVFSQCLNISDARFAKPTSDILNCVGL